MSLEATSGKNPINHVGKIYNLLAMVASKNIADEIDGIEEVYIRILSQIGRPIDQPHMAGIQIVLEEGANMADVQTVATEMMDDWLENISKIQTMIFKGELHTY